MSAQNKAGSEPAYPVPYDGHGNGQVGLTKRELACIELCIPATGDAELDALIARAQRRDIAAMEMQGLLASTGTGTWESFAVGAVAAADALIAELEKAHG